MLRCWVQLHADREQIAFWNRGDGEDVDPVWDFLYNTTTLLGSEGMSSDESTHESSGPPFYVRTREWRSRALLPYLQIIDRDRKRVNGYGNNRPGNSARERQRVAAGSVSVRKAIAGLPLNFYNKTWYVGLSARDRALLRPRPDIDMSVIIDYN